LEKAVIEKLGERVLTETHLTALVEQMNEEIMQAKAQLGQRREAADKQIADLQSRLDRLYGALEMGQLGLEDLAPRIKRLRGQIQEMESLREGYTGPCEVVRLTKEEITKRAYDLRAKIATGTYAQRKSVLRSFIRRIVIAYHGNDDNAQLEYTLPLVDDPDSPQQESDISREVLSAVQGGSPSKINHLQHSTLAQTYQNEPHVLNLC
jgi:hypothetical protein